MKADLHLHSTASDGTLEPGELVALAAELGFTHLALTDHDSVDGLARATDAARDCGVTLIPGVELSCGAQKEIHILGYGFDPYDERVLEFCRTRTMERQERAAKMVRKRRGDFAGSRDGAGARRGGEAARGARAGGGGLRQLGEQRV